MARIEDRPTHDEVLAELRATKERLAAALDFDVDKILDDAIRKQVASGRVVISPPPPEGRQHSAKKGARS